LTYNFLTLFLTGQPELSKKMYM